GMDGRKSLLNREGNGKICFLCMNLQKKTCLIHMEAMDVMQNENTASILQDSLTGKYTVYNKGIAGHNFLKICQYLPKNLEIYNSAPKFVIIETSSPIILQEDVKKVFSNQNEYFKSYNTGIVGLMQKSPFLRLLYLQIDLGLLNLFLPSKNKEDKIQEQPSINEEPYDQIFSYLRSIEEKFNTKLIIVFHPGYQIEKNGSISFSKLKYKDVFKKKAIENGLTFINLKDDFIKMYNESHHLPHGFITGKIGHGHLNKYGHAVLANAVYKAIIELEKER
ncbi:hypothetical protein SAMN05720761_12259, partial [Fibrobacter sp. UWCM]